MSFAGHPSSAPLPSPAEILKFNETYPALDVHRSWLHHGFTLRVPGIDTAADRELALKRLAEAHRAILAAAGLPDPAQVQFVEQIHGAGVSVVRDGRLDPRGADALCTAEPGTAIGIYVADCGPVWIVDPTRRAVGLAHSGRKGTELGIVRALVGAMGEAFGSRPEDLEAFLGPCIRPPHYEVDFAAEILRQCRDAGVGRVGDCGADTAADLSRYYSYRAEKGRTGRMLAWAYLPAAP